MTNSDAWQAGINLATGRKAKKKDDDTKPAIDAGSKPTGGLLGAASKGIQKLRGKKQPPGGGMGSANNEALGLPQPTATFQGVQSYRKGGRVKRTGLAYVHRGEVVIPAKGKSRRKVVGKRTVVKG